MHPARAAALLAAVLLAACEPDAKPRAAAPEPPAAPAPAEPLIDPEIPTAVAGEDGWGYWRGVTADLDGDGTPERVILTARVELFRGQPAWDDGQPWQVYVEAEDGTRTVLYSRRVQLGTATARVAYAEPGEPASVLILEQTGDRIAVYEVAYHGPGSTTVSAPLERRVDPRGEFGGPVLP